MTIAIWVCLALGMMSFLWAWKIKDNDIDLEQIPLFMMGTFFVLLGLGLFAGRSVFRYFTGG